MKQPVILKSIWLKVLIAFSFIIAFSVLYSNPNFFVIDGAAKYLSIYSLSKKQISMIYNGKHLDKDFTFHPFSPLFFAEKDNTAEIIYPPAFIYISYLCYRLLGNKGLYIPNLLGVFYFIVFISLICRKMNINENLAWILLISSPVLPYIFMFWEYTLFLGLFLGSVFFLVSNSLKESNYDKIMGGFIAGLALHLRTELMVLLVILFIHLFFSKKLKKNILFFFIALITVIPLIAWNYQNWGNPYGQHTLTNFRLSFVQYKSLFDIVLSRSIGFAKSFTGNFNIVLLLATILSIVLRFLYKEKLEKTTRILILTLSFGLYLIHLLSLILDKDPLFNLNKTQGFLTAYPILVFMIFIPEKTQINRYLIIILIYSIILAFLTQVTGGIQWGNRLILWAYPIISLFLASKWDYINKVCSRYSMFAFLSISLFIQIYGVYLVDRKYRAIYELNSFIEKDTKGVILTDSWWLNLEAIDKTKDRIVFMPKSSKKLLELCDIIKRNNLEFTYLSSPYYRFISSSTWKEVYEKADFKPIKIIKFDSPKAEYMKLDGVVWVLK